MKIGIVTCEEFPNLTEQEQPLPKSFAKNGVEAIPVVWNDPSIDWKKFDCLLLRSVWDYHLHVEDFFDWLAQLERENVKTLNSLPVINWNRNKFYLSELEQKGVNIIPTLFIDKNSPFPSDELKAKGWTRAVIKPAVSANSHLTETFAISELEAKQEVFSKLATERDLLVQCFMPEVQTMGEVSLIYFGKKYSHAVLKTPAKGDFRVQAEHGGNTIIYQPSSAVIDTASAILSLIPFDLLYARVDGIISGDSFCLMELELIEPELFFHHGQGSVEPFVDTALAMLKSMQLV